MQSTRRLHILVVVSLVCFLCPALRAQTGGIGSIIGEMHVRGDFPGRVYVELQFRGATIASQYSDDQGKFGFTGLESNPYHVIIQDDRFYPVDQQVMLDTSIAINSFVQIQLSFRPTATPTDSSANPPGGNPYIVDTQEYRHHFPKPVLKEFDKGVSADQKDNRDEAIHHYEKALTLAPDFYPAHNNLGSDYLNKSDFKSAQEHFEAAIKLNQSDAQARLNLGDVFLMTKNYDEALKNVEDGLRRAPQSSFGHYLLGSIYKQTGKLLEAERAFREALNIDPKMARIRLELVNLYLQEQKQTEASDELRAFLKDSPNDPLAPKAKAVLDKLQASAK